METEEKDSIGSRRLPNRKGEEKTKYGKLKLLSKSTGNGESCPNSQWKNAGLSISLWRGSTNKQPHVNQQESEGVETEEKDSKPSQSEGFQTAKTGKNKKYISPCHQ